MRDEAIFLNGVYRLVLEEILLTQQELPEQILFLQPYAAQPIRHLQDNPPSIDDPVRLYISTTDPLGEVEFQAEVVGIDDKRQLSRSRRKAISRIIWALQPNEEGLYPEVKGKPCVNLLHVRRLQRLEAPIPVTRLVKTIDNKPIVGERATAGGWSYVRVLEV
jgi:hypothetical protein